MPLTFLRRTSDTQLTQLPPFYANFLKTKQDEVIEELHDEIQKLKSENSELKFQLFVDSKVQCLDERVLCGQENVTKCFKTFNLEDNTPASPTFIHKPPPSANPRKNDVKISTQDRSCGDESAEVEIEEIKRLELELESARKIIEELKWVQVHCENKMQVQELKLEELQREIMELKSTELEIFQLQIPSIQCHSSRSTTEYPTETSAQRRRRSSSASRTECQRRSSLQSILPDNYKDSVATLPPITNSLGEKEETHSDTYRAIIKNHGPSTKLKFMPTRYRLGSSSSNRHLHGTPSPLPMKTPTLVESSSPIKKNF